MLRLCAFTVLSSAICAYRSSWSTQHIAHKMRITSQGNVGPLHIAMLDVESSVTIPAERGHSEPKPDMIRLRKSLPIHVYVDTEIRNFLSMKNSERKVRIMLPQEIEEMTSQTLRDYVEKKLPKLSGQPYILRFQMPDATAISARQFAGKRTVAIILDMYITDLHYYQVLLLACLVTDCRLHNYVLPWLVVCIPIYLSDTLRPIIYLSICLYLNIFKCLFVCLTDWQTDWFADRLIKSLYWIQHLCAYEFFIFIVLCSILLDAQSVEISFAKNFFWRTLIWSTFSCYEWLLIFRW